MEITRTGVYHVKVGGKPATAIPPRINALLGDISKKTRQISELLRAKQTIREVNFGIDPELLASEMRITTFRAHLSNYLLNLEIRTEELKEGVPISELDIEKLIKVDFKGGIKFNLNIDYEAGQVNFNFRHLGRAK